jgi:hypothetical protein
VIQITYPLCPPAGCPSSFSPCLTRRRQSGQLDAFIARYQDLGFVSGTALSAEKARPVLRKGYGKDTMESHIPNEPDTRLRLGSVTKRLNGVKLKFTITVAGRRYLLCAGGEQEENQPLRPVRGNVYRVAASEPRALSMFALGLPRSRWFRRRSTRREAR